MRRTSGRRNSDLGAAERGLGSGTPRTDAATSGLLPTQLETGQFVVSVWNSLLPTSHCAQSAQQVKQMDGGADRQIGEEPLPSERERLPRKSSARWGSRASGSSPELPARRKPGCPTEARLPDGSQAARRQAHSSHFRGAAGCSIFKSLFAVLFNPRAHTGLRMG